MPKFTATMLLALVLAGPAAADCLDLHRAAGLPLDGVLLVRVFPGSPSPDGDGDVQERTFILMPLAEPCLRGDDFHADGEIVDSIHVYSSDDAVSAELSKNVGRTVRITAADAFGSHTVHHHAPLVVNAAAVADLAGDENRAATAAVATVRGFYRALSRGDGDTAARLVIPEKREKGPLSAEALSAFYGKLAEPLTLVDVRASTAGAEVRYRFRAGAGKACDGRAEVTVTKRGEEVLISRIHALGGC